MSPLQRTLEIVQFLGRVSEHDPVVRGGDHVSDGHDPLHLTWIHSTGNNLILGRWSILMVGSLQADHQESGLVLDCDQVGLQHDAGPV